MKKRIADFLYTLSALGVVAVIMTLIALGLGADSARYDQFIARCQAIYPNSDCIIYWHNGGAWW